MYPRKTIPLIYTNNLVIGDPSQEGHRQTSTIIVKHNSEHLHNDYKEGARLSGVDLEGSVAVDYEDRELPHDALEQLTKHGFSIYDYDDDEEVEFDVLNHVYRLTPKGFALVWLFIAKIGNPKLSFEVQDSTERRICIGGYGLFE